MGVLKVSPLNCAEVVCILRWSGTNGISLKGRMETHIKRLVTLILAVVASGCMQEVVDAEMAKLCKEDGGMKIYETVTLQKDQFKDGAPTILGDWRGDGSKAGGGYTVSQKFNNLRSGNPSLTKLTYTVIRDSNQKILGTFVYYSRIGGALMPRLGPDPAKACPKHPNENTFVNAVFLQASQGK